MNAAARRILRLGIVPALGLIALTASSSITHAQGPGSHPPIVNTNPATLAGLEGGTSIGPGDLLKLDGSNLGTSGLVCLSWSQPGFDGAYDHDGQYCVGALDWQPTRIIAQLPAEMDGIVQQSADVAVYSNDTGKSNALSVTFYPTIVLAQVNGAADQGNPLTITCATGNAIADANSCDANGAYHSNGGFDLFKGDLFACCFTDTYQLQLQHGWTFVAAVVRVAYENDGVVDDLPSTPDAGATGGNIDVRWYLKGYNDYVKYTLAIWVRGPKGVPLA